MIRRALVLLGCFGAFALGGSVITDGGRSAGAAPEAGEAVCAVDFIHVRRGRSHRCMPVWSRLRRPLHVPRLAPGSPCPVSRASGDVGKLVAAAFAGGRAWGPGPAYPWFGSASEPGLSFQYPPSRDSLYHGSAWSGQKVLWRVDRRYSGPLLIRGRQLDGRNELRFDAGRVPPKEMRIASGVLGDWRDRPSFTRLRAPGCYDYQVDGTTFSRVIVFRAELGSS